MGSGMPVATAKVKRFSSSERRVRERVGIGAVFPLLGSREVCLELVDFIFSRGKLKEFADCCRFSAMERLDRRMREEVL